ncbi:hypothetical protein JTE90_008842 [Oedothorax gibbosus]|uniref:Phospholipase B-like n=1 Tax=Oedothorax gibbosus TaxID=931172 RepID=A0AAV6UBY4_9ARAC|nr:hypothetical protein JTE90_008842 [Oedothorax gibbosus]
MKCDCLSQNETLPKANRMTVSLVILCALFSTSLGNQIRNASVTYNDISNKFTVHDGIVDTAVAFGHFKDEIFLTGWSYLEIKSKASFPDSVQAYAAGLVEGYLTADLIRKHWNNIAADYCKGEEAYCKRLKSFLQKNLDFISQNVKTKRSCDIYWHHVALTLEQLHGLEDGYKNITSQPSVKVDPMGLLLINTAELDDLEKVLKKKKQKSFGSRCSALVKVLPNFKDIYFSHNTWTTYNSMLRVLKKYSLQLHTSLAPGSPVIPGHTYSFSSQPGLLFSEDDFYLISTGLATMETTIKNDNASLWKYVVPDQIILEWQRNIIANRLAKTGKQWVSIFGIMNSGTYNNQWMILDYNKFQPGKPLENGLLWILEQLPGYVKCADVTDVLRRQNYWPSYNTAYFKDIFNISGQPEKVKKYGDFFTYEKAPRALIFKRDHDKVTDVQSLIKLMRYNDYTRDPLSKCNCTPPYSAHNAISARDDLNPANGTYPITSLGHSPFGAIDLKVTTSELFKNLEFVAIAGPTYDPLPPFQWSKTDFDITVKHEGQPDLWKFKPIVHKWM